MTRYALTSAGAPARRCLNVAMLVANPGIGDARVMKEAESLALVGHRVTVFCLAGPGLAAEETVSGVCYIRLAEWHRRSSQPALRPAASVAGISQAPPRSWLQLAKARCAPFIQHELHSATFARAVAASCPDVIHAHDFETLPAAVHAARRCNARVVYDMHELEEGRLPAAGPMLAWWKTWLERRALRDVSATITVSPSIARFKAKKYGIPEPTIVLNAPRAIKRDLPGPSLRDRCGLGADVPLAVYVGLVTQGRGIEQVLAALALAPAMHLAILGRIRPSMRGALAAGVATLGSRLHVLEPVAHDEVVAHIASADLGIATIPASCLSYEYCLPNKLFEMVLAGLPVLVSNTTELARFVAGTGTGLAVNANDPAAIAAGLGAVYARRAELRPDGAKLDELKRDFGWQRQADRLTELYEAIANGPRGIPAQMAQHALAAVGRLPQAILAGS